MSEIAEVVEEPAAASAALAPRQSSKGVLKIKLGKCLTASNARFYRDLRHVALALNRAKNVMARSWQRWMEDHNFITPEARADYIERWRQWCRCHPAANDKQLGARLSMEKAFAAWAELPASFSPPAIEFEDRWISFQTYFYQQGRAFAVAPEGELPLAVVSSGLISVASADVIDGLKSKTSYRSQGTARYVWEAVLLGECNLPSRSERLGIGLRHLDTPLAWNAHWPEEQDDGPVVVGAADAAKYGTGKGKFPQALQADVLRYGGDACVLAVPLFSRDAGREHLYHVVRLDVGTWPEGLKRVLRMVTTGRWKYCDSELVWHQLKANSREARGQGGRRATKGEWYLHLVYDQPAEERSSLDVKRVAHLHLQNPDQAQPFAVLLVEENGQELSDGPVWKVGRGPLLERLYTRLERRRQAMRELYRVRAAGKRNHGRQRLFRDQWPMTAYSRALLNDTQAKTAEEVMRFCLRHNCGILHWRPPSLGYRPHCWFPAHEVPWDWTQFEGRLKHTCWKNGIVLDMSALSWPLRTGKKPKGENHES